MNDILKLGEPFSATKQKGCRMFSAKTSANHGRWIKSVGSGLPRRAVSHDRRRYIETYNCRAHWGAGGGTLQSQSTGTGGAG